MKTQAYLLLETEDVCSADGFSPTASLYLPSVLTCMHFLFVFSTAFEAEKMMKRTACYEFVLILGLSLSTATKAMAEPILHPVLLLCFSFSFLCFFFLVRALCFVPLYFCSSSLLFSPVRLPLPAFL